MDIILASTSPRRAEILNFFSLPFTQKSPEFDEESVPYLGEPENYVTTLAVEKAHKAKELYSNTIIIAADTLVAQDKKVIGKPRDEKDMEEILSSLSNQWHSVFTSVAVASPDTMVSTCEETKVLCNDLSKGEIEKYMNGLHLYDKAGAYAIQRSGALFVKEIKGCYYNVMGMPINSLQRLLKEVNIDLFNFL